MKFGGSYFSILCLKDWIHWARETCYSGIKFDSYLHSFVLLAKIPSPCTSWFCCVSNPRAVAIHLAENRSHLRKHCGVLIPHLQMFILSSPACPTDSECIVPLIQQSIHLSAGLPQAKRFLLVYVSLWRNHVYLKSSNKLQYTQAPPCWFSI